MSKSTLLKALYKTRRRDRGKRRNVSATEEGGVPTLVKCVVKQQAADSTTKTTTTAAAACSCPSSHIPVTTPPTSSSSEKKKKTFGLFCEISPADRPKCVLSPRNDCIFSRKNYDCKLPISRGSLGTFRVRTYNVYRATMPPAIKMSL